MNRISLHPWMLFLEKNGVDRNEMRMSTWAMSPPSALPGTV